MSFYEDASLVMIPSGYKSGKIYSQKPLSTDGQLTFTRASEATRVASNGLIEKVRTNILLHSEAFDNAVYNKGTGGSISANSVTAPDGTMTADAYTWATATTTYAFLSQTVSGTSQIPNTFSIYIKRPAGSGSRTLRLAVSDVTISTSSSSTFTITESWQRFQFTRTSASTTGSVGVGFFLGASGVSIAAGEVIDVWGAQLETGDIATDYIATTTAAVSVGPVANIPRLDYLNSTCPKLLLEPQRTNLQLNSEQFDNATWAKVNTVVTANQIVSPDGNVNADKLDETTANSIHQIEGSRTVTVAAYTMSVFAKKGERNFVRLYEVTTGNSAYFNLNTGAIGTVSGPTATAKIENYGNGWYRCSLTYTETGTFGRYRIVIAKLDNEAFYAGTAGNGIYIYGAQYELGAYATSYIPTLAASQTRVADAASKTGISSLIGQTEGVVFVNFNNRLLASYPNEYIVQIISGTTQLWLRKELAGNSFTARLIVSGSTIWTFASSIVPINGNNKIAIAYKTGNSAVFLNGAQVSSTNTSAFSGSAFADLNFNFGGTLNPELPLSQALLFTTRLTNAQLAELTA